MLRLIKEDRGGNAMHWLFKQLIELDRQCGAAQEAIIIESGQAQSVKGCDISRIVRHAQDWVASGKAARSQIVRHTPLAFRLPQSRK